MLDLCVQNSWHHSSLVFDIISSLAFSIHIFLVFLLYSLLFILSLLCCLSSWSLNIGEFQGSALVLFSVSTLVVSFNLAALNTNFRLGILNFYPHPNSPSQTPYWYFSNAYLKSALGWPVDCWNLTCLKLLYCSPRTQAKPVPVSVDGKCILSVSEARHLEVILESLLNLHF